MKLNSRDNDKHSSTGKKYLAYGITNKKAIFNSYFYIRENDTKEYIDVSKMKMANFSNLKPSTTSISLRLSDSLLEGIRRQANQLDVPYQSLMKIWLTEKLGESASN